MSCRVAAVGGRRVSAAEIYVEAWVCVSVCVCVTVCVSLCVSVFACLSIRPSRLIKICEFAYVFALSFAFELCLCFLLAACLCLQCNLTVAINWFMCSRVCQFRGGNNGDTSCWLNATANCNWRAAGTCRVCATLCGLPRPIFHKQSAAAAAAQIEKGTHTPIHTHSYSRLSLGQDNWFIYVV